MKTLYRSRKDISRQLLSVFAFIIYYLYLKETDSNPSALLELVYLYSLKNYLIKCLLIKHAGGVAFVQKTLFFNWCTFVQRCDEPKIGELEHLSITYTGNPCSELVYTVVNGLLAILYYSIELKSYLLITQFPQI